MCVHTKEVLKNSLYKHILKYKKKKLSSFIYYSTKSGYDPMKRTELQ